VNVGKNLLFQGTEPEQQQKYGLAYSCMACNNDTLRLVHSHNSDEMLMLSN